MAGQSPPMCARSQDGTFAFSQILLEPHPFLPSPLPKPKPPSPLSYTSKISSLPRSLTLLTAWHLHQLPLIPLNPESSFRTWQFVLPGTCHVLSSCGWILALLHNPISKSPSWSFHEPPSQPEPGPWPIILSPNTHPSVQVPINVCTCVHVCPLHGETVDSRRLEIMPGT